VRSPLHQTPTQEISLSYTQRLVLVEHTTNMRGAGMTQQNDPGIVDPAGYLTRHALVTFDGQGRAATVGQAMPLPVTPHMSAAAATPLAGSTDVSGSFGPFVPDLGRPI
jgi:hypothetical protein